jgi:pilus assembly protein Flp/PilA
MTNENKDTTMDRITGILVKRLRRAASMANDVRGATAIEYAIMASGIALVIMSTVFTVGDKLKENFYDKLAAMF